MLPTKQELDALYLDRVRRARLMTPEEKIREGFRLFEEECERIREGIRGAHPYADGPTVERMLHERLVAQREKEEEEEGIWLAYYEVKAREP